MSVRPETTKMMRWAAAFVCAALLPASHAGTSAASPRPGVTLSPCHVAGVQQELRCGVYPVFENRRTRQGRRLPLKIVVIPARHPHPEDGPIFFLAGGPGETATELADYVIAGGDGDAHDLVLVDERGTGQGHRLDCPSPGSDDDLQGYLKGPFDPAAARACAKALAARFDLRQYTTANFADDLDEVRQAMGYDRINLLAGSFGTYAAQIYMRRHGAHVRAAYLVSLVTLANRVPLNHAWAAQYALDQLFGQCDRDPACHRAYPHLRADFAAVMDGLRRSPANTWVRHPTTGARTPIRLTAPAFADAVRVMMYRIEGARRLPLLIEQARAGDFNPFAEAAVSASRDIYTGARMGLNYAITCNEFVARIRPEDIAPATQSSFLGDTRVRDQMAACASWPKTELPAGFFKPFRLDVPAVLVSGDTDPGTPPRWGEVVRSFMPNAIHLVVPGGGHVVDNACVRSIREQLWRTGSARRLDLACVAKLKPAPIELPAGGH